MVVAAAAVIWARAGSEVVATWARARTAAASRDATAPFIVVKVLRKIGHAIEDQRWMLGTDYCERVKKEEGIGGRAMFM
jgi:hypothetical protein